MAPIALLIPARNLEISILPLLRKMMLRRNRSHNRHPKLCRKLMGDVRRLSKHQLAASFTVGMVKRFLSSTMVRSGSKLNTITCIPIRIIQM